MTASGGKWRLRLYVAGRTTRSIRAIDNLRSICERFLPGEHEVEIIDLLIDPALAERDEVIAIPTLVRVKPAPVRKIIGDLSDLERVLAGLELDSRREPR